MCVRERERDRDRERETERPQPRRDGGWHYKRTTDVKRSKFCSCPHSFGTIVAGSLFAEIWSNSQAQVQGSLEIKSQPAEASWDEGVKNLVGLNSFRNSPYPM